MRDKTYVVTLEDVESETFYSGAIDEHTALELLSEFANAMRAMTFGEGTIRDAMSAYLLSEEDDI